MVKKIAVLFFVFFISESSLFSERLGAFSIEEGKPLPFGLGVSFETEDGGFIQVFIHDSKFAAVLLDSERRVKDPANVVLITVHAQFLSGNSEFYPYHLQPSTGGLVFSNPRHVWEPYQYHVKVELKKEIGKLSSFRTRRLNTRFIRESYGVRLLKQ